MKKLAILVSIIFLAFFTGLKFLKLFYTREPPQKDIIKGYQRLKPVILFFNEKLLINQSFPENTEALYIEYKKNHNFSLENIFYILMDTENIQFYKLYTYIQGRTSLWYLSAPDGWQNKGWWIDYDDGSVPKKINGLEQFGN
jgi:hypothetical protein